MPYLVVLVVLLFCNPANALDPTRALSQYAHTAWRMEDGMLSGAPHVITQTTDGYLWIGTESGLVRFDGVRFVEWKPPDGKPLAGPAVVTLLGARDGSLWIGTKATLHHWDGKTLTRFTSNQARINAIVEDHDGGIWVARAHIADGGGPLCKAVDNRLQCYGKAEGLDLSTAAALAADRDGNMWMGGTTGICRWRAAKANCFVSDKLRPYDQLSGVTAIAATGNATLSIGSSRMGPGLGLQQFSDASWKPYKVPGLDTDNLAVEALRSDRDDVLWVGSQNRGLIRLHAGSWDHFGSEQGLSSDDVEDVFVDREGNLWATTTKGIDRFRDLTVATFSKREGLTLDRADSVVGARDNTIWIGNDSVLDYLRQGKVSAITSANGLPGQVVTSLFQDHEGTLWVGIARGLAFYKDGHFHSLQYPGGQDPGVIGGIAEDVDHTIWALAFGKPSGLLHIRDGVVLDILRPGVLPSGAVRADPKRGVWIAISGVGLVQYGADRNETLSTKDQPDIRIRDFIVDPDGSAWAATNRGVVYWANGGRTILDSHNGLPCDRIFALIRDNSNALWMASSCGFIAISDAELKKWERKPDSTVAVRLLDSFDGAQPAASDFQPNVSKSTDGKLWFANGNLIQAIDPNHLDLNSIPPPVHIEQAVADRKTYTDFTNLRLPPLTRDLEIDYTALSLSAPQKVRFRYLLDGRDKNWIDAGTRRQAFYNDLRPGTYKFRVIACNNDGVWNDTGAALGFILQPAFYQTTWFLLLCCAVTAMLIWLVYSWRMRELQARLDAQYSAQLAERTRIARELHDTLLQGFLSASMQLHLVDEEIPAESSVKARLTRVLQLMEQVIGEGRNALRGLRSSDLESDDLEQAFSRIAEELASQGKIDFRVIVEGEARPLQRLLRDDVYRIGREAVANAVQHAQASMIELELEYALNELRVTVRDNGRGIDPQVVRGGREGHWGLAGMRERAERVGAQLRVWSRDSGGTEVELRIPAKMAFQSGGRQRWFDWF